VLTHTLQGAVAVVEFDVQFKLNGNRWLHTCVIGADVGGGGGGVGVGVGVGVGLVIEHSSANAVIELVPFRIKHEPSPVSKLLETHKASRYVVKNPSTHFTLRWTPPIVTHAPQGTVAPKVKGMQLSPL
jgi:hypothetical protein